MIKVIMKVSIASPDWAYHPGQEIEIEDYIAKAWAEVGHCEIIEKPQKRGEKNANHRK